MTLYREAFTNDLVLSDAHPITPVAGGFVYEVRPADRDAFLRYFRLKPTSFAKKDYMAHIKTYLNVLKGELSRNHPEEVPAFTSCTSAWVKEVLGGFDDYHFFTGISQDSESGLVILAKDSEDGQHLTLHYLRNGLKAETADPNVDPWAGYEEIPEESFTDELTE